MGANARIRQWNFTLVEKVGSSGHWNEQRRQPTVFYRRIDPCWRFSMKTERIPEITKWWLALLTALVLLRLVGIAGATSPIDEQLRPAAGRGDPAQVKIVLDKGANVNAEDDEGATALMATATRCHAEVARLLLDKGAEVNARDTHGETALMRVLEPLLQTTADVMRYHGPDQNVVLSGNAEVKYGSRVLPATDGGRYKGMVQLLLDNGADVNLKDKDGRTALTRVLGPLIEVKGDSVTLFPGKGVAFRAKVKNGMVHVKPNPPNEIVELIRARGTK